jgi:uncharacterized protein (TIGR00251 family)
VSAVPGSRTINVRVVTRARKDEVAGERNGRLLVRTTAPPVEGQANEAVRRIVAEHFDVPTRSVECISGSHSRDKVLRISE